jgi:intracellular septation protein A
VSILAPIATYQIAVSNGFTELQALLLTSVIPLANAAWILFRRRKLDPLNSTLLAAIVVGGAISVLVNDPRVLLVKDSIVTGAIGLAFLVTLLTSRPLLVSFASALSGDDPERLQTPLVRPIIRRLSVVWGLALLAEAVVRVALSFILVPTQLMAVSPVLAIGVFGGLAVWTLRERRLARVAIQAASAPPQAVPGSVDGFDHRRLVAELPAQ